jgi:oxygen-independent coproporphyrinogen-3 oxidase
MDAFVQTLLADIEYQLDFFAVKEIPSIYIGGGTPSVLGARRMGYLLARLGALIDRACEGKPPVEFTVEANPESADEGFLRSCREGGVNRISLGVQSFHEPSRRALRRLGEASRLDERLALVSQYFPGNFSADLIAGLPFQTGAILLDDLRRLSAHKPGHVSLYSLTIEPGTPLEQNLTSNRAAFTLPDRDEADSLWLAGRDFLRQAGYEHYEVSNFALPGKRCGHNIRYWAMENWLGAGPAASGTLIDEKTGTGRRYTYAADIDGYINAPGPALQSALFEELDQAALIRETLLMGFRYCEGPDSRSFRRRFGRSIEECIPLTIERWRKRGFFVQTHETPDLVPSADLMLFLDGFLRDAFVELGNS